MFFKFFSYLFFLIFFFFKNESCYTRTQGCQAGLYSVLDKMLWQVTAEVQSPTIHYYVKESYVKTLILQGDIITCYRNIC